MKRLAVGMMIGIAAVAVSAFLVFYIVPRMTGARLPLRSVPGEWITLHFPSESPVAEKPRYYVADWEEELATLANMLGVARDELPDRVNLFVHNDGAELMGIIARRKNPLMALSVPASVDIVFGDDVRPQFIQLIGDFTRGENRLRLLRHGIIEYVLRPETNHHLAVAALPEELQLGLEDLLLFDGRFPLTRYQLYNSPYSAAAIMGLEGILQLAELERIVDQDVLNMAVSLVAFLSEHFGGLAQVMRLWRPGSLDANLQTVYGYSLEQIDRMWRDEVAVRGPQDDDWPVARGRGLIRAGRLDEALSVLQAADTVGQLTGEIARETGRIFLLWGNWQQAEKQFLLAQQAGIDVNDQLRHVDILSDWETVEAGSVRIHRPPNYRTNYATGEPASFQDLVDELNADLMWMMERLEMDETTFPEQAIMFLGVPDEAGIATDLRAGVLAVSANQQLNYALAELVIFHLWRDQSLSPLLQRGLVRYLSSPADYLASMQDLLHTEDWIPLHLLDFSNFPAQMVEPLAAGLIAYLLEVHGVDKFHTLWRITSPLGGRRSLDTAMSIIYGFTRRQLDELLLVRSP